MKFQFEPDLDYQQDAIAAVCDLFRGQEVCRSEFTVSHGVDEARLPGLVETDLGVGNLLTLPNDAILANLQEVQLRNSRSGKMSTILSSFACTNSTIVRLAATGSYSVWACCMLCMPSGIQSGLSDTLGAAS